jgi:hypothetical protein
VQQLPRMGQGQDPAATPQRAQKPTRRSVDVAPLQTMHVGPDVYSNPHFSMRVQH